MVIIMDGSETKCVFKLLKSYDVILAPRLIALLKEVDVNNLRTLSKLDSPERRASLEEAIRESVSAPMRFKTDEEKLVVLGEKFATDPSKFKFSFGEKITLEEVVTMSKRILQEYSKQYTFSRSTLKRKSSVRHDAPIQKKSRPEVVLSNVSGGPSTAASATEDEAAVPAPLIRKGRTLHDYVMKWFQTTKMLVEKQIAYLPTDCKIIAESSSIKCLKCDVILKTGVDEYGGWKISHFVGHHLPRFHKIAPEPQETNSHQPVMDPTRVLNTVP